MKACVCDDRETLLLTLHKVKTKIICQLLTKSSLDARSPRSETFHNRGYLSVKASASILPLLVFSVANLGRQGVDFDKGVDIKHDG